MAEISRLPGPFEQVWTWQRDGACRSLGSEPFFHPEGERGRDRRARASAAKSVCGGCVVVAACRRHALQVREPYGVWGGLTEEERAAVLAGELAVPA